MPIYARFYNQHLSWENVNQHINKLQKLNENQIHWKFQVHFCFFSRSSPIFTVQLQRGFSSLKKKKERTACEHVKINRPFQFGSNSFPIKCLGKIPLYLKRNLFLYHWTCVSLSSLSRIYVILEETLHSLAVLSCERQVAVEAVVKTTS